MLKTARSFSKWRVMKASGKTMKTGEEFVSVNRWAINLSMKINRVERNKKC